MRLLPEAVTLVHGPGCPVCVTPLELIDKALAKELPKVTREQGHDKRLLQQAIERSGEAVADPGDLVVPRLEVPQQPEPPSRPLRAPGIDLGALGGIGGEGQRVEGCQGLFQLARGQGQIDQLSEGGRPKIRERLATDALEQDAPGPAHRALVEQGAGQVVFLNGAVGGMVSGDNRERNFESSTQMGRPASTLAALVRFAEPRIVVSPSFDANVT